MHLISKIYISSTVLIFINTPMRLHELMTIKPSFFVRRIIKLKRELNSYVSVIRLKYYGDVSDLYLTCI